MRAVGVQWLAVSRWEDTADFIEEFLASWQTDHEAMVACAAIALLTQRLLKRLPVKRLARACQLRTNPSSWLMARVSVWLSGGQGK